MKTSLGLDYVSSTEFRFVLELGSLSTTFGWEIAKWGCQVSLLLHVSVRQDVPRIMLMSIRERKVEFRYFGVSPENI